MQHNLLCILLFTVILLSTCCTIISTRTIHYKKKDGHISFITLQDDPRISLDALQDDVTQLVIRNIRPADAGEYVCTASNRAGETSASSRLVVECKTFKPEVNQNGLIIVAIYYLYRHILGNIEIV